MIKAGVVLQQVCVQLHQQGPGGSVGNTGRCADALFCTPLRAPFYFARR
jgi:hypothetical protein